MDEKSNAPAVAKVISGSDDVESSEETYAAADVGEHRPGYTKKDKRDMYQMGKRQELMVGVVEQSSKYHK